MTTNEYNTAVKRLVHCYQDFLMWLFEYCKEKNPEIVKDMGFVGHLERTIVASDDVLEFSEGKSRNATGGFKSRGGTKTLISKALNWALTI
jgi:hypothetical protein